MKDIPARIAELEAAMAAVDFWQDKDKAQCTIREIADLKIALEGRGKYDKGDAVLTILSGAGGDDAEDFSAMLLGMYYKFFQQKGWTTYLLHEHKNDHGGYRNITIEIRAGGKGTAVGETKGLGPYGVLKNESGVHRLVRISPFNAKQMRHTSFSLVEVIPKFEATDSDIELKPDDLKIEFAKSSGPGGQNVNKRETAVRIVHIPTKIAVHVESERSQAQNKEKALDLIKAKLYVKLEDERKKKEKGMYISATTDIEWGNQIRSYVLHPYKMVKDHRTNVETSQVDNVLNGDIDDFILAEKDI